MFFMDHTYPESNAKDFGSNSYANLKEADLVAAFVLTFIREGISPEKISVLTAYKGQMLVLRRKLQELKVPLVTRDTKGLTVLTVDQVRGCSFLGMRSTPLFCPCLSLSHLLLGSKANSWSPLLICIIFIGFIYLPG